MNSPSSYYTACSSPMVIDSASSSPARHSEYRHAVPISKEIANHCHIYFDEKLYASALSLVTALVNSGTSHPDSLSIPALAPLPIHIEIVSILLVHPQHTTQAPQNERAGLPSRCLSFLRSILSNLGPLNANLAEAFSLTPSRSRGRRRYGGDDISSDDEEEETSKLQGIIANEGRIRNCATDFWHIVGWAFNCSVVHRKRWKYWKVWLGYMLDVLDADWKERERLDEEDQAAVDCFKMRRNCLLAKYLSEVRGRSSALKRVAGSIFVDGGSEDLRSYPEIFTSETMEVNAQNGQKRKREDDFEQQFGDYNDDEEDLEFDSGTLTPSQENDDGNDGLAPDPWMGGLESIALRQRVLTLLSRVAHYLPDEFVNLHDLYEVYCDNLRLLPLQAFSLLVSPYESSQIPSVVFVSLSQFFMMRHLANNAPPPQSVSPQRTDDSLSIDIVQKCFLPFAANTTSIDDNAKVSMMVEGMFRLVLKDSIVYYTLDLETAIEKGIMAREGKAKIDRRRRERGARKKDEESDRIWLTSSGKRLRSMLASVEQQSYSERNSSF